MGRGRLSWVAAGLVATAALTAATAAGQARPQQLGKFEVERAATSGFLDLGKQRGYEIGLYMPNDRVVVFHAFRSDPKRELFGYSLYAVRNLGDLQHGVVRARFGSMGRVSLRFRPNGEVRKRDPQSGCEGGATIVESGRFVGHLRFRDEGFIQVSSARGEASISRSPRLRCEKGEASEPEPRSLRRHVALPPLLPDEQSIALLHASSRSHGRYVGITAVHPEGAPPGADVQLAVVESRPAMAIGHNLYLAGSAGTLLTSLPGRHPATATLAPPAPFYGEAAYSEQSDSWTGTLRAKVAGSNLPLAGPGFKVHLCVTNPLRDRNACEFFKQDPPYSRRAARPGRVQR